MSEREEAFTIILASAFVDVGRTMPHAMYEMSGGGLGTYTETDQEFFSAGMRVKNGRARRPVELSVYLTGEDFAAVKKDAAGAAPLYIKAGARSFWGPVLFDRNAEPDAPVLALGKARPKKLDFITNGELLGAVHYAGAVLQKAQKTDSYVERIGRALKPGTTKPKVRMPARSEVEFFREIRDILGPDAVPVDFR